jgi:uncharacterized protein (TIGR03086 family)
MDIAHAHRDALAATERIVAALAPDQFGHVTPCAGWDVGELLHHLVYGNLWVPPLAEGETIEEVGDRFEGDIVGEDFLAAYRRSAELAASAFEVDGALEASCAVSYGPITGEVYAGHRFVDVLIHGWDLAVATDQRTTLSPELVEASFLVVEPQLDLLRESGCFSTTVEVPDDADPQTRLLALLGRSVKE